MAKSERKLVDKYAQQQMSDIKSGLGATTADLQGQVQPAREQAGRAYGYASSKAMGLAEGEANPYATNLAVTGGISEDEAQKMETAATRGVRSVYDVLGAEAKRRAAITGGYGGSGEIAQMARQSGQRQAEAVTGAKAETARLRQTGRMAGTEMIGAQQMEGARLLTQQFGLTQDQVNVVMNQIVEAQKAGIALTQGDIELLAQMSKQPGAFSTAVGAIGQLAGAAGGVMGGLGSMGVKF